MSNSGAPSALVDAPQNGYSMKNNGARTDIREQEAVYDIMKATGNDWATDIPDVCRGRWHGIECMPDKDNIYHIVSLSFGALSDDTAFPTCNPTRSFISPSITKLPHLRTLFFYRCFSGNPQPIPAFLGQLGHTLQTLVLRENGHVGPIPNELGNLTRLMVLDLHKNNLNGSIPVSLGRITGLSRNRLSGPIPESMDGLKDLILMDLSYNNLSSPLPKSLRSLNSLQALILNGNPMMSTTLPNDGFDGLKDLMILILSDMNLHGTIPQSISKLPNLRVLHVDGNNLNGSIPASFRDMNNLSELRLNSNRLSGRVPFGREMVWRMRRKLRLQNNSGLCYDARNGFEDGLDSTFDLGIGHCETTKPGTTRTVQHLSNSNGDLPKSLNKSSASVHKFSIVGSLLHLTTFLLFFFLFIVGKNNEHV
ncbi:hypothetical protein F0562_024581 [Nyssa sinensis]|uniref:Leucine-rich repeat-containing N-terminal plant-type domain-containing protein n=1 Tax=Nyssa sinensis TaxID=561372 RepID=A0A5J5BDT2_9ASTE|nr:hypothetical protein F0562_024581 [Nyssa sinensis]